MCSYIYFLDLNGDFCFCDAYLYLHYHFPLRIPKHYPRKLSLEQAHVEDLISLLNNMSQFLYPMKQNDLDSRSALSGSTWKSDTSL